MSKPTFLFCPGAWHTTELFSKVISILEPLGYRCVTVPLPSIGRVPPTKDLDEDIAAIRAAVMKELGAGRDVVTNAHSWSGIPVSSALDGLGKSERQNNGLIGAVTKLTYVASFVVLEGTSLLDSVGGLLDEWVVDDNGNITFQADLVDRLYHDLPRKEAEERAAALRPQSLASFQAKMKSPAAWRKIPVAYLVCEDDMALPSGFQDAMANCVRDAGGEIVIERIASSHSPYLSQPGAVVDFLRRAAGEVFSP